MAANEAKARNEEVHYSFYSDEVSERTGGHRWTEKVAETGDGSVHRLLAVDGKALSSEQVKAEADRIDALVQNPESVRLEALAHRGDEVRAEQLLQLIPRASVITPAGEVNGCVAFTFHPNPAFHPSSYEERIAASVVGMVSLRQSVGRLCTLQAKMTQPVDFGFGLLGRIEQGSCFSLERVPVNSGHWKSNHISVHLRGHVMMLKTLTRSKEIERSNIHELPLRTSLKEAAELSRP